MVDLVRVRICSFALFQWMGAFIYSSSRVEQLDPEELGLPSGLAVGLVYGVLLIQVHRCCFSVWHSYSSTDKHPWNPQLTVGRNSGHQLLSPASLNGADQRPESSSPQSLANGAEACGVSAQSPAFHLSTPPWSDRAWPSIFWIWIIVFIFSQEGRKLDKKF